jgi:hypothetical protein
MQYVCHALWIHVSNTHPIALKVPMPFLQFKSGALHFADDIGFTFIKAFIAADGPKTYLQWDVSR